MRENIYVFNPDNDMALAANNPFYMAPANALRMADNLSVLPAWYAEEGSSVWVSEASIDFAKQSPLSPEVEWVTQCSSIYNKVRPWGWNPALLRRLREAGADSGAYPDDEQMRRIRILSGRQTAMEILQSLRSSSCPSLCGESMLLSTLAEVEEFVFSHPKVLLKSPWSGSGRGIQHTSREFSAPLQGWARHVLHTQAAVMGEPYYDKVKDFAMEFYSDACGEVSFAGYSCFETDIRGIYKENLLARDADMEDDLSIYVPKEVLSQLCHSLKAIIKRKLNGDYQGYLGVDMMICREESTYVVHPCVEVNLRMNMGVVARVLYDKYVCKGQRGRYVIEYYKSSGEAERMHRLWQQQYPLVTEEGRVKSGYLSLTPVHEDTAYQAYIIIEDGRKE